MCRKDGEPGGPRRCGKHMALRLASARAAAQGAYRLTLDRENNLAGRLAWMESLPGDSESARQQVRQAQQDLRRARERSRQALLRLRVAQRDYDSTREGLQELREAYDRDPGSKMLTHRLVRALDIYDAEAERREVAFGPQSPLSRGGVKEAGDIGKAADRLGVTGWLKSAREPDTRTGLFDHRVNLVWTQDGVRRSLTLSQPTTEQWHRGPGLHEIERQPTLSDVCARMDDDAATVNRCGGIYPAWLSEEGQRNSLLMRQRWRAMVQARDVGARLRATTS